MAERFDVSLHMREIGYIGSLIADKKGTLFPLFRDKEQADISGEEIERLKKAGVLTASGSLAKKAENAFRSLADADAYASFGYNGARIAINIVVYFSREGRTFIMPEGDMVRIAHPADPTAIGEILTEIIGTSVVRSIDVDVTLPNSAALCFAAAVDLVRRSLMGSILDRHRYERSVMPKSAIADWLSQDNPSPQWLATRLKTYLGIRGQVAPADMSEGLDALVKAKLFQPKGDALFPSEVIERIAERYLVIDTLIFAKSGRLADKKTISISQFEVIQSGFSDLLLWEAGGEKTVRILSVSPKLLVSMLTDLISNREALKGMPTEAVPEKRSGESVCRKCGKELAPDAGFCPACGQPTGEEKKPEERTCAGCGRKLPADAKFCDGCGKAVE